MEDDLEARFWGNCENTFGEELKQLKYLELMGFQRSPTWRTQYSFDAGGKSIIDIGGGPCSVLLKFVNLTRGVIVDPGAWPPWVAARYAAASLGDWRIEGELVDDSHGSFDLALIYNCLQHVQDPAQVVRRAISLVGSSGLRMFEWIDLPAHEGHPHELKAEKLNEWTGREGRVVTLTGESECYGRAWVLGSPSAKRSRIVLGGA
jgi:2-polyprenyl-3-methyl-5-hydroxy-6-metoxy-1,4-benzoquinol methylase